MDGKSGKIDNSTTNKEPTFSRSFMVARAAYIQLDAAVNDKGCNTRLSLSVIIELS